MSKLISDSPTIAHPDRGGSMQVHVAVGSGSRPTASKVKIATSAPANPKTLGREPPGALK